MTPDMTPAALRQSLEQRLRTEAGERGITVNSLRLKLLIERFLARLFVDDDAPWLVKGGYAMELRLRDRARTTKDLDLACDEDDASTQNLDAIRERLQEAAERDLGDHLVFRVGEARREIDAAPAGGARFGIVVMLAGREYGRFGVDVGRGPVSALEPELATGSDRLAFLGIPPAVMRLVPREVQFAEKLHAYTRPWSDRENTRTKDLVDLALLVDAGFTDAADVRRALTVTFADREGGVPTTLAPPPASWIDAFAAMATEVGLATTSLGEAFDAVRRAYEALVRDE